MPLGPRVREPFTHLDWIFEVKWDGFRSLVQVEGGECRLISRNGNAFKSFPALNEAFPQELRARSAVLGGEIVALDRHGKSQFRDLLFRRGEPRFYAFDLLSLDGEDLRYLPLIERKARLRSVVPSRGERLLSAIMSKPKARAFSGWRARPIWKASWPSTSAGRTNPS